MLESRQLFGADLMFNIASVTAAGSGPGGALVAGADSIAVNATIFNRGDDKTKGADLKVILTRDFEITSDNQSIGKMGVPNVEKRTSWIATRSFTVPAGLESGDYYVFLRIQPYGESFDYVGAIIGGGLFGGSKKAGDPSQNNTRYTGVKVTIAGATPAVDVGLTTGGVRANLSGPGSVQMTRREDGMFDFVATGTNKGSKLTIENADGFNHVGNIHVTGSLNKFEIKVALTGNLTIDGTVKELKLRYVNNGVVTIGGTGEKVKIEARDLDGASIVSGEQIDKIEVYGWYALNGNNGTLSAPWIKEMRTRASFEANVAIAGVVKKPGIQKLRIDDFVASPSFVVRGGIDEFRVGDSRSGSAVTVLGEVKKLDIRGDASGLFSATSIKSVKIERGAADWTLLAGAFLGSDARLGGAAGAADTFGVGTIKEFEIKKTMVNSIVGVGLNPMNSVVGDSDDRFVTTAGSRLDKIKVVQTMQNSKFYSPRLPGKASVNGTNTPTMFDPRFISVLG
ncbi:MAG: hypothetical protein JSR77_18540 [Planctomycetes bacterium]|nr:hypothetical protein [Planctomycetota bacterium]